MLYYAHVFKYEFVFFVLHFAVAKTDWLHIIFSSVSSGEFWLKKTKHFFSLMLFFLPFHFQRMRNLIKWEKSLFQPSTNMFFLRFHLWASETVDTSAGWWTPLGEAGPLLRSWWVHILTIDNLLCSKLCGVTAFSSTLAVCTEPQSTQNTADLCVLDGSTVSSISGFFRQHGQQTLFKQLVD